MIVDLTQFGVVTNPDKQKNRGMKFAESDVKKFAVEKNLKIYQPEKVKENLEFIEELKQINPDLICVVAYGKILPKEILNIPKLGCINLHASLLPRYRGAAPIQWAVLNGDKETGVSTIYMNEKMDEGDIIFQETTAIGEYETTGELWDRLSKIRRRSTCKNCARNTKRNSPQNSTRKGLYNSPDVRKEHGKDQF